MFAMSKIKGRTTGRLKVNAPAAWVVRQMASVRIPANLAAKVGGSKEGQCRRRGKCCGANAKLVRTFGGWRDVEGCCDGGAEEDRTPDLRIANATLSQLSYRPTPNRFRTNTRPCVIRITGRA